LILIYELLEGLDKLAKYVPTTECAIPLPSPPIPPPILPDSPSLTYAPPIYNLPTSILSKLATAYCYVDPGTVGSDEIFKNLLGPANKNNPLSDN